MIRQIYSYAEYRRGKLHTSIIDRYENFVDWMQSRFGMPTAIVGLHNSFKNKLSGQERDITQVTPRILMSNTGVTIDRNSMSGIQASVSMLSTNSSGNVGDNTVQYRRLPVTASFDCQIVVDSPSEAIRLCEYICLLALEVPQCKGDEFTKSTVIMDGDARIENKFEDSNDYIISFKIDLNCQILEPMTIAEDDTEYVLGGVGVQNPDGTWDETPWGEPIWERDEDGNIVYEPVYEKDENGDYILDENGNKIPVLNPDGTPVLEPVQKTDDDGNPLFGAFVRDGSFRLRTHAHIHPHRITEECGGTERTVQDKANFLEYAVAQSYNDPEFWVRESIREHYPLYKPGKYNTKEELETFSAEPVPIEQLPNNTED